MDKIGEQGVVGERFEVHPDAVGRTELEVDGPADGREEAANGGGEEESGSGSGGGDEDLLEGVQAGDELPASPIGSHAAHAVQGDRRPQAIRPHDQGVPKLVDEDGEEDGRDPRQQRVQVPALATEEQGHQPKERVDPHGEAEKNEMDFAAAGRGLV